MLDQANYYMYELNLDNRLQENVRHYLMRSCNQKQNSEQMQIFMEMLTPDIQFNIK